MKRAEITAKQKQETDLDHPKKRMNSKTEKKNKKLVLIVDNKGKLCCAYAAN